MHIANKQIYIFLHQTLLDYESCSYWATYLFHAVKSKYKVRLDYCVPLCVSLLLLHTPFILRLHRKSFSYCELFTLSPIQAFNPTANVQAVRVKNTLPQDPHACVQYVRMYVYVADKPWQHISPSDTLPMQSQELIRASLCGYFLSGNLGRPSWDY